MRLSPRDSAERRKGGLPFTHRLLATLSDSSLRLATFLRQPVLGLLGRLSAVFTATAAGSSFLFGHCPILAAGIDTEFRANRHISQV